ncbi:MAG: GH36-type glycosyl hydrolase domain-containing protein [Promethearchaeota archaeon]
MSKDSKPYGSGIFGTWIVDDFDLPAYNYMLDQTEPNPGIAYLTKKDIKNKNKISISKTYLRRRNVHLIGNDNTIGLAVNNNTVQVFSGERGAKYLNKYAPKLKGYSGGFGFVKDGNNKWAMIYSPKTGVKYKDRIFGMGYFKKSAEKNDLEIIETIFTPFGSDSVFLIEVKLKNKSNLEKSISYFHYWDILFNSLGQGGNIYGNKGRWSGFFLNIKPFSDDKGLYAEHVYKRWWHSRPTRDKPSPVDFYPPIVFLKFIDNNKMDSFETRKRKFFRGKSNVDEGVGLNWNEQLSSQPLLKSRGGKQSGLMVVKKKFKLKPGEQYILKFIYGYHFIKIQDLDDDKKEEIINNLIQKFEQEDLQTIFDNSMKSWKNYTIQFSGEIDDFISREQTWHSYYLRAGANYHEYFDNYTIQQGGIYTYDTGANICLRDPLQHALPMVYLFPELAREVLLYTLKTMKENKEIPYGITGHGFWTRLIFYPSDIELYLLLLLTEYFLATRDYSLFEQKIPYYPATNKQSTVKKRIIECIKHLINDIGVGTHQLIRMLQGDWNDMIIISDSWNRIFSTIQYGESCLNSAIASYVMKNVSDMFKILDGEKSKFAEAINNFRNKLVNVLNNEWNGKWYNRGYTGNGQIIGKNELYISHQPWTIIGGVAEEKKREILVNNLYKILSAPSDIGAICYWGPTEKAYVKLETKGTATNGGIWYSLNMPLIWAYSKVNREYAWEEYKHIHLANRAEKYPGIWESILSSSDSYNSYLGEGHLLTTNRPGKCMPLMDKFPVMVMHSCATPLFSTIRLSGIEVDKEGLIFSPKIINYGDFHLKTELVEIGKVKERIYGKYKNKFSNNGRIRIKIDMNAFYNISETHTIKKENISLEINKKSIKDIIIENNIVSFYLEFKQKGEIFDWNIITKGVVD